MRVKRLAAVVAIAVCLAATTAWGSNWTGGDGNWTLGTNWSDGVPDGTNAYIGIGQAVTLDTDEPDITTLDVVWFSTLNIQPGADLAASGGANVAGGGNDWSNVAQSGGVVSLASNLAIANGEADVAAWTMTGGGSLAVGNNLTIGGNGDGDFYLRDNSSLTVAGNIGITGVSGGGGNMTISGGTLGQLAGGGDPAILADLTVGGAGSLHVEGSVPTMNVATYNQTSSASLHLVLDNGGIATINVQGDISLGGTLNVSTGAGLPPPGVYDILVSDTGTVNSHFGSYIMDQADFDVRYETRLSDGKEVVRLYYQTEAPELEIRNQLPGDAYDKIVSINIKGGVDETVGDVLDGAGVVAADNWNNLVFEGFAAPFEGAYKEETYTGLVDNSGAPVSVSLKQTHSVPTNHPEWYEYLNGGVDSSPSDPNYNLYASQAPAFAWDNTGSYFPDATSDATTLLTELNETFPNGYDVIINVAKWPRGTSGWPGERIDVYAGPGLDLIDTLELDLDPTAYVQEWGFEEGKNYVKLSNPYGGGVGLAWDTLRLNPYAVAPTDYVQGEWQSIQITGIQLLGLAPATKEVIVDNSDPLAEKVGLWYEGTNDADEWPVGSRWTIASAGTWYRWNTPVMPFAEVTEYEVFVWYTSEPGAGYGAEYAGSDSMAEYTVHYAVGFSGAIIIDQSVNSGTWVSLGFFQFSGESAAEYVQLTRTLNATGPTSADAVRWLWARPEVPVPEPAGLGLVGFALLVMRRKRS